MDNLSRKIKCKMGKSEWHYHDLPQLASESCLFGIFFSFLVL